MTTIGQVVATIRDAIKERADDSVYSNRFLWDTYYTIMKQLIKRDADNGRIYSMSTIWNPICVEMEPVSALYCNCMYLPYDCTVYRSKKKLPKMLESSDGFIYRWIATPDMSKTLVLVSPFQYAKKSKVKYNLEKYAFIHDGYLYTPSETYPLITISGLFNGNISDFMCGTEEDTTVSSSPCISKLAEKVQIPDYLEEACLSMALSKILPSVQLKPDEHPNANTFERDISM